MEAWTPVKVNDESHERHGQAGCTVGQSRVQTVGAAAAADKLDAEAKRLEDIAAAHKAGYDDALRVAKEARKQANAAAKALAAGGTVEAEAVEVKFDADDATVVVPVASLQQL